MGLQGSGDTLINLFQNDHGIYLQKPVKGRSSGWSKIKELLHNAAEMNGKPGLYISERCTYLWQTMPFLPRDPKRPDDLDSGSADHGADTLRYLVTSQPSRIRSREVLGHY
jgi:hypothetical protein